jgi:hypothetical protein
VIFRSPFSPSFLSGGWRKRKRNKEAGGGEIRKGEMRRGDKKGEGKEGEGNRERHLN